MLPFFEEAELPSERHIDQNISVAPESPIGRPETCTPIAPLHAVAEEEADDLPPLWDPSQQEAVKELQMEEGPYKQEMSYRLLSRRAKGKEPTGWWQLSHVLDPDRYLLCPDGESVIRFQELSSLEVTIW
jgi:hypothetical protein